MAHVAEYKKKIVKDIVNLASQYPIIGVVNMENLPAPQLQKMRAQLRETIKFSMTKKRLMKIALEQAKSSKKDIEKLKDLFTGMPALIFTKENPFRLFRILKKNKSPAPAKAGQTAPRDIIVPAGPTSFAPGPIIGELGQIGIKTGVEGGKVAVKSDSVVARKGEKIKPKVAEILTRLGIEPMEVGLDLVATYEDGTIYSKDILDIDEDRFMADLSNAGRGAFNLAMLVAYPTKNTIEHLISKAFNDSKALGLSQNIIDEGVIDGLLAKAQRQMLSLSSIAKIEVKEEKKEEVKEEKPKVEAKPEVKEEKPKAEEAKPEVKAEKPELKKEEKKPGPKPKVEEKGEKPEIKPEIKKEEKKPEAHVPKVEEKKAEEEKKKAEEEQEELKKKQEEEKRKAEEERKKQEELRKQEEARKAEEHKRKEEERKEEKKRLEEQKRIEEEKKKQEEARKRQEEQKRAEEERKKQEEAQKAEEEKKRLEEQKRIEEEKRRAEEQKKEEVDVKVKEMVEKTKKAMRGSEPTAADILEEVEREQPKKPEKAKEIKKEEIRNEVPEAQRLVQELQRKGTLRGVRIEDTGKKKSETKGSKNDEQKEVEELLEKLKRKGTLRK